MMWWILCTQKHFDEGKLPLSDSLRDKIAGEKLLCFFPGREEARLSESISLSDPLIEFQNCKSLTLPLLFQNAAFATHVLVRFDDGLIDRALAFSEEPLFAEVSKEGENIRIAFFDPETEYFQHALIKSGEFDDFTAAVSKETGKTNELMKTLGEEGFLRGRSSLALTTDAFLKSHGLKIDSNNRFIKILYRDTDALLPLEFLPGAPVCFHRILSSGKRPVFQKEKPHFLHLYARELSSARTESKSLLKLRDYFEYSLFSLENQSSYGDEIKAADILHFSGHGDVKDGSGRLKFSQWQSHFDTGETVLTVLHACLAGQNLNGVVKSALSSGSAYVAASPFELPDELFLDFARLYPHFSFSDQAGSLLFWSILDPRFGMLFRLFERKFSS